MQLIIIVVTFNDVVVSDCSKVKEGLLLCYFLWGTVRFHHLHVESILASELEVQLVFILLIG